MHGYIHTNNSFIENTHKEKERKLKLEKKEKGKYREESAQ